MKVLRLLSVFAIALTFGFGLGACAKSDLHNAMEDMGDSLKSMSKTDSLEVTKADLAAFIAALDIAKQQPVKPEDQSTFDEGMKKIQDLIQKVSAAVEAGDLPAAKATYKELGEVSKEYHEKFDVK